MAEAILMPRLSDTMTEGVVAAWHKKVGDTVKKGDLLAEIETDKATMELESYQDGILLHIGTPRGGKLQVNDLLAILENKEKILLHLLQRIQMALLLLQVQQWRQQVQQQALLPLHRLLLQLQVQQQLQIVLMQVLWKK